MSIFDSDITRIYKCTNIECEGIISCKQKVKDDWIKTCPFCGKDELVIESGEINMSIMFDLNKPKTLGMVSQKNADRKIKEGNLTFNADKKKVPFWRKNKKINYDILKNPNRYIAEGTV
jgi:hypothetical protein